MKSGKSTTQSKQKNPHRIRGRKTTQGIIELWLGEPGHAESECVAQFHEEYLGSVKDVLDILKKLPVIESSYVYGMKTVDQPDDVYCESNGFLKRGRDKCPDCNVSLHWNQLGDTRLFYEREPGYSFYKAHCPDCKTHWEVRK